MKILLYKACLFISCICYSLCISAQNNLPPVYEIKNDTANVITLANTYWQMLPDKKAGWNLNDVSKSPLVNNFYFRNAAPKKY